MHERLYALMQFFYLRKAHISGYKVIKSLNDEYGTVKLRIKEISCVKQNTELWFPLGLFYKCFWHGYWVFSVKIPSKKPIQDKTLTTSKGGISAANMLN